MLSIMKMRRSIRGVLILFLAAILVAVPLFGLACDNEDDINAKFSASSESGLGPLTVEFTDQSKGDIDSYAWDFNGDGVTDSTDQNPSYTFELGTDLRAKVYTVVLTVTLSDGSTYQATKTITVTPVDYPDMTLKLSCVTTSGQIATQPAVKFAELLELYTGGDVKVDIYAGGSLFNYGADYAAVVDGSMVDIVLTHPYLLSKMVANPNLDPFGAVMNLVVNLEHGRAIYEDGQVSQAVNAELKEDGVHLLGWSPTIIMGGLFNKVRETAHYEDLDGLKYGALVPGAVDPVLAYYGVQEVNVYGVDEIVGLVQNMYNLSGVSPDHAVQRGLLNYHKHVLLTAYYTPMVMLMNLAKWDSLDDDLQSLIDDVIWPEIVAYAEEITLKETKEAVKVINDTLSARGGTVHIQTPAEVLENFNVVMAAEGTAGDRMRATYNAMDDSIIDIIEELRPTDPQIDPEILEILEFADIEAPS